MRSADNAVDVAALKKELQQRVKEFDAAEKAGRSQAELNAIYQKIKDIRHQITFAQPDIQRILNSPAV